MPWFWIPEGFVYTSEEPNFINYDIKIDRALTMWSKDNGFGAAGDPSNQSLLIPNAFFYHYLRELGLDRSQTQRLFISFIFLSITYSFWLFSTLFTKEKFLRSMGMLVYIFNFYVVTSIGYTAKTLQLVLMPALFYIVYRYIKTREIKYLFLSYIWLFIFQGGFTNLPLAVTSLAMYLVALLYYLFTEDNWNKKTVLVDFIVLVTLTVPVLLPHFIIYLTVLTAMKEMPALFTFTAIGAPLSLLFQMRGAWWEKSGHLGVLYFNLGKFYSHFLTVISAVIGIGMIIISTIVVTWDKSVNNRRNPTFWLAAYLLGIGLASGFYFLPGFYHFMMEHIPMMVMFRETWAKFVPLVVLSVAAMTLVLLDYLSKNDRKRFFITLLTIVIYLGVQSYPFFSGSIVDREVLSWKRRVVKIPQYWEEYSDWTKANQKVILPIPFGVTPFDSLYRWSPEDIGNTILPVPCILGQTNVICNNNTDKYINILKAFTDRRSFDWLQMGGVEMVMIQEDLDTSSYSDKHSWQMKEILNYVDAAPVASFGGKLRIYKIRDQYSRPIVYATQEVLSIDRNNKVTDLPLNDLIGRGIFVNTSDLVLPPNKTVLPEVSTQKISQTEYGVEILNASEPFVLVLNQSFDRNWNLNIGGKDLETQHFLVNGFANGWFIEPGLICDQKPCDIKIKIEFRPQQFFRYSVKTSLMFFLISVSLVILIFIRNTFFGKHETH